MKSLSTIVFALLCLPAALSGQTADSLHLTGCTRFWTGSGSLNGSRLQITLTQVDSLQVIATASFSGSTSTGSACSALSIPLDTLSVFNRYTVSASLPDLPADPLNGITVADLICISRHIQGLAPFDPHLPQAFAADVNNSHSVTTFDLLELRKLLLGIYPELPNSANWKMLPAGFCPFNNPNNPFPGNDGCDNSGPIAELMDADSFEYLVLKTGDVDGDAVVSGAPVSQSDTLFLHTLQRSWQAGEQITIPVSINQNIRFNGLQLALRYDPDVLEFVDLVPASALGTPGINNVVNHIPDEAVIRFLYMDYLATGIVLNGPLFTLTFSAKKAGNTQEALYPAPDLLRPVFAVDCGEGAHPVHTIFDQLLPVSQPAFSAGISVGPVQPNPFTDRASLRLRLERPQAIRLEVFDAQGRLLQLLEKEMPAGTQQLELPVQVLPYGTIGIYRLRAGTEIFSGKLVRF